MASDKARERGGEKVCVRSSARGRPVHQATRAVQAKWCGDCDEDEAASQGLVRGPRCARSSKAAQAFDGVRVGLARGSRCATRLEGARRGRLHEAAIVRVEG